MPSPLLFVPLPRSARRTFSRDLARKFVRYNGPAPRYEPARNLTCEQHHRRLPCKRCA